MLLSAFNLWHPQEYFGGTLPGGYETARAFGLITESKYYVVARTNNIGELRMSLRLGCHRLSRNAAACIVCSAVVV